jgi:hypothetical protein
MINSETRINRRDSKYNTQSKEDTYQFRYYDSQIRELFEPEGRLIIYLTLILILGLVTSIIFFSVF